MPVILAHRKWRREDQKLKIILGYIGSLKSVFHIRPYLSEVTGIVRCMETERRRMVFKAWRDEEIGRSCLIGPEFQVRKMRAF